VKGLKARADGLRRYFWTGMRAKAMKPGIFGFWTRSRGFANFFAWQNGYDYREYILIKAPFFWQNQSVRIRRRPGTAPDDDPI
jgi:hypothetical protein